MTDPRSISVYLLSGSLFGAGLQVGGMTDPTKVRGFLDVFGQWDPTLAFVMATALLVMAAAWRVQSRLRKPLLAPRFVVPDRERIDGRLVAGSVMFGVGWALVGLCPGPAIAGLFRAPLALMPFILSMVAGMAFHRLVFARGGRGQ